MTNTELSCPDCEQYGFVAPTGTRNLQALLGAICHCCGHVVDENEIARRLKELSATAKTPRR
jgi:hypothetical protein